MKLNNLIKLALENSDKYQVVWDEPASAIKPIGFNNFTANIHCTMTIDDCICKTRYIAYKTGHHIMSSDATLLEEFIVSNWAWIEEV